jgi:hypothetical protein
MTKRLALIAAIAMLGPVSAYGQEATGGAPAAAKANPCNARRFETIVNFVADGKPRRSRVRICGEEGQSDQDWVRTLKDSLEKTAASTTLGEDAKTQIITALKAEIADVEAGMKQGALTNLIAVPPPAVTPQQPSPATRAPSAPIEYSSLPPMPTPKTAAGAAAVTASLPPLPRPKITIRCLTPGQIGGAGPCDTFERDTLVTVRADENLPSGVSLRFLRRGDNRAEIEVAQLRKGQAMRFTLPSEVCRGVVGSRIELEVVRRRASDSAGRPVDTLGPYELRC